MADSYRPGDRVRLVVGCEIEPGLDPDEFMAGTPVGSLGTVTAIGWFFPDDVMVRFGEMVFQCCPGWLAAA